MAVIDTSIPFAGRPPQIVNALALGSQAAAQRNELARANALAQLYQTQGADIAAGNQGALNALAQFDPMAALGVQDARQGMDARALQMDATRLGMDATRQDMTQQAREWANTLDDREREQRLREGEQMLSRFIGASTPEAWAQLMTELGKPELAQDFGRRNQMIANMLPPVEALRFVESQNAPRETQFIVSGENDYGLPPQGTYNVTVGPNGVSADPIGSIPSTPEPNADERQIALLQEIPNPQTGQNFTREEAIAVTQLYQISRDPVTGDVVVVNKADGSRIGANAPAAQPAAQPAVAPPPAQPDVSFNASDDAARAAFGLRGFGANLANTATDTLGMGQIFPQVSQAQTDFSVAAESILSDMASAWARQPPSWVLQAQNSLIPRPGSIFTGPDTAREQLEAIKRNAETELASVTQRLSGAISPTVRAELEAQASALASGIAKLNSLSTRLQPSNAAPEISQEDADFLRSLGLEP